MGSVDLRKTLEPLFLLSRKIDNHLPSCTKQFHHNQVNSIDDGVNELKKLTQEVDQLQVSSKETLSSLNDKSKLFENVGKCLHQSFELADACASILEAKLALKGYNPPNILSNENSSLTNPKKLPSIKKVQTEITESKPCSKNVQKDNINPESFSATEIDANKTFCIKPVASSTSVLTDLEATSQVAYSKRMFDSPKLPEMKGLNLLKNEIDICSPKMPILDEIRKVEKVENKIESLSAIASLSKDLKVQDERRMNPFFPDISSPVTPVLTEVVRSKSSRSDYAINLKVCNKLKHLNDDDDDDDLIIHTRASLKKATLLQDNFPVTPECTVNLLQSNHLPADMNSPDTPLLEEARPSSKPAAIDSGNKQKTLSSPDTPDLSVLKSSTHHQSIPTLTVDQYDGLSSDVKRLVSYEQACYALRSCYERAREKDHYDFGTKSRIWTVIKSEDLLDSFKKRVHSSKTSSNTHRENC